MKLYLEESHTKRKQSFLVDLKIQGIFKQSLRDLNSVTVGSIF